MIYGINSSSSSVTYMQCHVITQAIGSYAVKKYLKNVQIFKFIRSLLILAVVIMVGILINV